MSASGPSGPLVIVLNVRDGTKSKYPSIVFLSIVKICGFTVDLLAQLFLKMSIQCFKLANKAI